MCFNCSSDALSEAPEESESSTTDEEYEPGEDDDEDDDEIDAQDEDGHHFRTHEHAAIDTPDENSYEGGELPLESELDVDDEMKMADGIEDSMDIEESTVAILNVTSLATGDTIENGGMAFTDENDTDSNFEKDEISQPVLIISSICSVDKSVIDQIVSATKEADAEAEANLEVEAALEAVLDGDIVPIEALEDIKTATNIIETIGLNAGVIKDIPVEAEEFEEIGSVVKALLNFESMDEPPINAEIPLRPVIEAGVSLAEDSVFQHKEPGFEKIFTRGEETQKKTTIVEEQSTEIVDTISKDSETKFNLEIFNTEVPTIVEKISEPAVAESDDIQSVWDSLLDPEQNKNKRKADESFEKVSKKLDTKVLSSSADEDSLVDKEPSGVAFCSYLDGAVFPESDTGKDAMGKPVFNDICILCIFEPFFATFKHQNLNKELQLVWSSRYK